MRESLLAADIGHKRQKVKTAQQEFELPTALVVLTPEEFKEVMLRGGRKGLPEGYAVVNDVPVAFGDAAVNRGDFIPKRGAKRYVPEYYGTLAAISMGLAFKNSRDIAFFGSYPSELVQYREQLLDSVGGSWEVLIEDRKSTFRVRSADAQDEPITGVFNRILSKDGTEYDRVDIFGGTSLVIDIGGGTTDFQGMNKKAEPDYNYTRTITLGVDKVIEDFKKAFLANNKDAFSSMDSLTPEKVADAIREGVYWGGGRKYNCLAEVQAASNRLITNIKDYYENFAGGATRWDHIVLTGGGSALLETHLRKVLLHDDIVLAEDPEYMQFANVRGAFKLAKFYAQDSGSED